MPGLLRYLTLAAMVSLCHTACAERVAHPSGVFAFWMPGRWTAQQPRAGVTVWTAPDSVYADVKIVAAEITAPGDRPLAEQLEPLAMGLADQFPGARTFVGRNVQAPGGERQIVCFQFPVGTGCHAVEGYAFRAGGRTYGLFVAGPDTRADLEPLSDDLLAGVDVVMTGRSGSPAPVPVEIAPAAPTRPPEPEPEAQAAGEPKWTITDLPDQAGVQVKEQGGGGAVGELRIVHPQTRKASELLKAALGSLPVQGLRTLSLAGTANDRFACATYQGTRQGEAVRGEVALSVGDLDATVEHIWAPTGLFDVRRKPLRELLTGLVHPPGAAGMGGADAADVKLTQTRNRDGSAWISVPDGWVVSEGSGMLRARGPQGTVMVGVWGLFWTQAAARQMAALGQPVGTLSTPVSDYLPPEVAIQAALPYVGSLVQTRIGDLRVLSTDPVPGQPGAVRQHLLYTQQAADQPATRMEAVAFVTSLPLTNNWQFGLNTLAAPQATFARDLPLLVRIYQTYGISHALLAQRLAQAVRDQDAITGIIQEVTANRAEVAYRAAERWDKYIRGVIPTTDPATGETRDIAGVEDIERWAQEDPHLAVKNLLQN